MSGRRAIVTLAIGEDFAERWQRDCEANWREYADRHGYELVCITEPLDDSQRAAERSPSWQKLLVLGQPFAKDLDRLVWVDSDVIFGHDAPDIAQGVPPQKIGAVDEWNLPSPRVLKIVRQGTANDYYGAYPLPKSFDQVVQAGVMVTSPRHHREVFEHVYDSYEDKPGMFFEMRPLSYELLNRDLVHWIDPRFNVLWIAYKAYRYGYIGYHRRHPLAREAVQSALREVHCLHFAGEVDQMAFTLGGGPKPMSSRAPVAPPRSPVVLFLFARPDTSAKVLDAIRRVRPGRLLVVADAARAEVDGESERCAATRALVERIDWDCEVLTNFAEEHLGQTERVESGLEWAFGLCEEAIVLEDDTVPDPSFFSFCDELLERYRNDTRVLSIIANGFNFDGPASGDSYYFSRYFSSWGWATWRRAWLGHQPAMDSWPELRDSGWLEETFSEPSAVAYWSYFLERTHRDRDSWDRAWMFDCWRRNGLNATPNANLVSNIGFRNDATNTQPEYARGLANIPPEEMALPLRHPADVAPNLEAEEYADRMTFGGMVGEMFSRVRQLRLQERAAR